MPLSLQHKIAILGFGREGVSTYRYLRRLGVTDITILDARNLTDFSTDEQHIISGAEHIL